VQTLSKEKYQNELLIDQLRVQSKDLGENKSVLTRELEALRADNKQLDQNAFEQEKQINVLQLRASGLQQQLMDKEEVIAKTTEMLQSAQAHNQEVEDSLKMYRDNHARLQQKLELSISEINKVSEHRETCVLDACMANARLAHLQGNEIIERIQNESRALKSKMKMKTKIIKQQEQVVEEKQLQREELMLQLKSAREDLRKRDDHIETLKVAIDPSGIHAWSLPSNEWVADDDRAQSRS
jgi:spindle assembly abnormal protein 6